MRIPLHVDAAINELLADEVVVRPPGWRAANDEPYTWTRAGYLYRGMTADEYEAHKRSGVIRSTGAYSIPGEGTNFADEAASAESYANHGRDDPRRTGKPTYLIEVENDPHVFRRWSDGYYKAPSLPFDKITRAWRMRAEDDAVVARRIR